MSSPRPDGLPPQPAAGARPRRLAGWAGVAAGVVVLTAAGVTACAEQPKPSVGGSTAAALASPATPAPAGDAVPTVAGALPPAPAVVAPARLQISKLGLSARVDAVGIDERTGDFAVPPSVDVVGWYRYGPGVNATAGSIVIAGHVDSAREGGGAFFRLRDLGPGDAVTVTGSDGAVRRFTVVAREVYPKAKIPLERYFARDGAPRLTLITCGGPFDAATRHYRDNVVITAQPAG
ncbi:class F sortase [Dactylosporangium aurantiacum]|uniref:Class F sortase n=1 Tax=Dactylosporangium aurantiacum TaxID=35754 RepID=A0A9Q9I8F1_9ACTN|nr:class F sortase [Dactylosporangium aurantiacum]MDG6109573.1 class F sortase [Dactylosporangium aurantiacum]UWZ51272.1 class F sortase [Dactylosporangium aurantiacum]